MNPVVVVGAGLVGMRCAQEILKNHPNRTIQVFGDEPYQPYNRVKLSGFLNRDYPLDAIELPEPQINSNRLRLHSASRIVSINRQNKQVVSADGLQHKFDSLVLALGSSSYVPDIAGINKQGVYTFRGINDALALQARQISSRHVVVIGGGLLGLEAAKAMNMYGTCVTVVEHNAHLMYQQLDAEAGALLKKHMESLNIGVLTGNTIKNVFGGNRVEGIELLDQQRLECDTVIVATGIRPNIQLARDTQLAVRRGITVNDKLQTSDPSIYAIGDCAEHNDIVYGLVSPGYEQAAVAASNIIGNPARYAGSIASTSLKVAGCHVFSMGDVNRMRDSRGEFVYRSQLKPVYRRVNIQHRRVTGSIAIGEWSNKARLQEAVQRRKYVFPWQLYRFKDKGELWPDELQDSVALWSGNSIVCHCTGVSRAQLSQAIKGGASTIDMLCTQTGAASVCGSCKPNIANLLGTSEPAEPISYWKPISIAALVSAFIAFVYFFWSGLPYQDTVIASVSWDALWRESFARKVSGFSLLGGGLLLTLISFRKRIRVFSWLQYSVWRLLHVLIGTVLLIVLLLHSGARMGDNLNQWLMLSFLGVILSGGLLGVGLGNEHKLPGSVVTRVKSWSLWFHLLFLWPLPVLLGFHILKAFYFK